jgi:hypothetical protein
MRFLIVVAALMLGGCWMGDGLYSSGDARQPISAGVYRATARDEKPHLERVTLLPDGMTRIADEDGNSLYGFAPLDSDNRRFVVWYRKDPESPTDRAQMYMLLEKRSDDEFVMYLPSCDGADAETARSTGAKIEDGVSKTCVFPTRASLEGAMRQIQNLDEVITIVRVHDK